MVGQMDFDHLLVRVQVIKFNSSTALQVYKDEFLPNEIICPSCTTVALRLGVNN